MGRYAESTQVSTAKSRDEIERTLQRYGADQFIYGWQEASAVVGFRLNGRQVKFSLPLPKKADFALTETGRERTEAAIETEWEKGCRQRWRALALAIKAKLECVESGITQFEEEFLAHIVLPDGSTAGQHMVPQIASAYESGQMPDLLPNYRHG